MIAGSTAQSRKSIDRDIARLSYDVERTTA